MGYITRNEYDNEIPVMFYFFIPPVIYLLYLIISPVIYLSYPIIFGKNNSVRMLLTVSLCQNKKLKYFYGIQCKTSYAKKATNQQIQTNY